MSKQGCKTLRKMFVFMALFPPLRAPPNPLELRSQITRPPPPSRPLAFCSPPPAALSRLAKPSRRPFLFYFLPSAIVFQSARGRSYFSCLFSSPPLLDAGTPPTTVCLPAPRFSRRVTPLTPNPSRQPLYRVFYPSFGRVPHYRPVRLPTETRGGSSAGVLFCPPPLFLHPSRYSPSLFLPRSISAAPL